MVSVKLFLSVSLVTEKTQLQDDLSFLPRAKLLRRRSAICLNGLADLAGFGGGRVVEHTYYTMLWCS